MKTVYEYNSIVFERMDLIMVCNIDLVVSSEITLYPIPERMNLSFDIYTHIDDISPRFRWPGWYRPWESALSECARRDINKFLDDVNAENGITVKEFAINFRTAMNEVFDFAKSKLPICMNNELWSMIDGNRDT